MYYVYEIQNKEEPFKCYVGVTLSIKKQMSRLFGRQCRTGSTEFRNDIHRLGIKGFQIRIIECTKEPNKSFYRWIKLLKPYYNRSSEGGMF